MAENEAARQTAEPIVICDTPDVCLTPVGSAKVPVPYEIVAYFYDAQETTTNVVFTEDPVFTTASHIPSVIGDEAGVDLGVVSGSHAGGGICHVVQESHTLIVKAQGNLIVFHSSKMEMNCSSPEGTGNTIGTVVWQSTSTYASADSDGNVEGDTNPEEEAETEAELDKALEENNPGSPPKEEWKLKDSEAGGGYNQQHDQYGGSNRQATAGGAERSDGLSTSAEVNVKAETNVVNESLYDSGGTDNFVRVGNVDVNANAGYSYDATAGTHNYGVGGDAGVYGLRAQAKGEIPGGLAGGNIQGEALSAKASGQAGVFHGNGNVGAKAGASAEANLVKVQGGVEATLTVKRAYDSTIGALLGRFDSTKQYATAPDALDFGVVVGAEVEVGIGAGAAAEAEGSVGKDGAQGSARVSVGLGPKAAVKVKGGIKLPEGAVDSVIGWAKGLLGG